MMLCRKPIIFKGFQVKRFRKCRDLGLVTRCGIGSPGGVRGYSSRQQVRTMDSVTLYGSQLDEGRLSSRYPFLSSAQPRGMRILAPRLATPVNTFNFMLHLGFIGFASYLCQSGIQKKFQFQPQVR